MKKILLVLILMTCLSNAYSQNFRVVENSGIAKLAARIKKEKKYAITFGKTIFINCKKEDFFSDSWWVRHELVHVRQYNKHGVLSYLTKYFFYSIFHKYSKHPFEKEAIAAEFPDD